MVRTPTSMEALGRDKFETVRNLGRGSAGTVDLVRSKLDGKHYALKCINLEYLNEKDRRSAEHEV